MTASVKVRSAGGALLVLAERGLKIIEGKAPTLRPGQIRGAVQLGLSPAVPAGRYTVALEVRDHLGDRGGAATADFILRGAKEPAPAKALTIAGLRNVGDAQVPTGSVIPLAFEARGFATRRLAGGQRQVDLAVASALFDSGGKQVARQELETLRRVKLLFAPRSYPAEHTLALPPNLRPGLYRARLELRDRVSASRATAKLTLRVLARPRKVSIHNIHIHDAAHLPRTTLALGEQAFVRLSVQGLAVRAGRAAVEVDLGITGPDGGIYLARKNVAPLDERTAKLVARLGRRPLQVPLVMPALAQPGTYRLVVRARDTIARRSARRELRFRLAGQAPAPLERFAVDQLQVRLRPDLPTLPGDSFLEGRSYHLVVRVGGVKLKPLAGKDKATHLADLEATITLLDLANKPVAGQPEGGRRFELRRELRYQPLRLLIGGEWKVPAGLRPGLYTLSVRVENRVDRMVSQLSRRVAIHSAGRVADVPL